MYIRIRSASVGEETSVLRFQPGINILWGQNAEDFLLTLAGIFGGKPRQNLKAETQWNTDTSLFISVTDGACRVERAVPQGESIAQIVKAFHKLRILNFKSRAHLFDGSDLPAGFVGAGDLLLKKLAGVLTQKKACPLFICNFLERLDESVDLQGVLETLNDTGRQVFIAVPHYYNIKQLEELPYDIQIL